MNARLENFARKCITEDLAKLPENWQRTFKLMYGRKNGKRSVEDAIMLSIDEVVKEVRTEELDWALTQVDNSLKKLQIT